MPWGGGLKVTADKKGVGGTLPSDRTAVICGGQMGEVGGISSWNRPCRQKILLAGFTFYLLDSPCFVLFFLCPARCSPSCHLMPQASRSHTSSQPPKSCDETLTEKTCVPFVVVLMESLGIAQPRPTIFFHSFLGCPQSPAWRYSNQVQVQICAKYSH